MITEDYVSFETAKLLNDKGFDEYTISYYDKNGSIGFSEVDTRVSDGYQRPTLQMAMKWLREVHHLQICIASYSYAWEEYVHGWQFVIKKLIFTEGVGWNWDDSFDAIIDRTMSDNVTHETYEETCEAAIKHCLENLI